MQVLRRNKTQNSKRICILSSSIKFSCRSSEDTKRKTTNAFAFRVLCCYVFCVWSSSSTKSFCVWSSLRFLCPKSLINKDYSSPPRMQNRHNLRHRVRRQTLRRTLSSYLLFVLCVRNCVGGPGSIDIGCPQNIALERAVRQFSVLVDSCHLWAM